MLGGGGGSDRSQKTRSGRITSALFSQNQYLSRRISGFQNRGLNPLGQRDIVSYALTQEKIGGFL